MTDINNLTALDTLSASDLVPVWSGGNGDTRRISLGTLATYLQNLLTVASDLITQYATPTATGQTTLVTPLTQGASVWLQMTPLGAYAAGTITLPAAAVSVDGQEVLVTSTLAVTTLTVNFMNASGVSAAVTGAPATMAANAFWRMRFDGVFKLWIRVG